MAKGTYQKKIPYNEGCLVEPRKNRVIVLENLNFIWDESELNTIRKMWNQELSVYYMALYFDRDPDEVVLAIIHLSRKDLINKRQSGILDGVSGCFDKKAKIHKTKGVK